MKMSFIGLCMLFFTTGLVAQQPENADEKTTSARDSAHKYVEVVARFPGGFKAWRNYLEKSIDPDVGARNGAKEGSYVISVRYNIGKTGTITIVEPLSTFGYGMEEEVMRVICNSPVWQPATRDGNPVDMGLRQSFTFVIDSTRKKRKG